MRIAMLTIVILVSACGKQATNQSNPITGCNTTRMNIEDGYGRIPDAQTDDSISFDGGKPNGLEPAIPIGERVIYTFVEVDGVCQVTKTVEDN